MTSQRISRNAADLGSIVGHTFSGRHRVPAIRSMIYFVLIGATLPFGNYRLSRSENSNARAPRA